jgi:hypothetical protein
MWESLKGIDLALYIFLLTGIGYLVTFLYEWGYKSYFGISMNFIELSISTITKSITMVGIFIGIGFIGNLLFDDARDIKTLAKKILLLNPININRSLIVKSICIFGMLIMIIGIIFTPNPLNITYIAGIIIFAIYYFSLKQYTQLMFILLTALMLIFPFMIGVIIASQKEKFYTIEGTDQLIIVFVNEKAITAKFDTEQLAILSGI